MHLAAVSPLLLLCALLSVVAAQPQLPELPDEFSVYIEGAIINRNYTVRRARRGWKDRDPRLSRAILTLRPGPNSRVLRLREQSRADR
jgi:hypothetical protein